MHPDSLIIATINFVSKKSRFSEAWFANEKSFQTEQSCQRILLDLLIIPTINSVSKNSLYSESWFANETSFQPDQVISVDPDSLTIATINSVSKHANTQRVWFYCDERVKASLCVLAFFDTELIVGNPSPTKSLILLWWANQVVSLCVGVLWYRIDRGKPLSPGWPGGVFFLSGSISEDGDIWFERNARY